MSAAKKILKRIPKGAKYECWKLKDEIPIINFIVLEFPEHARGDSRERRRKEVWFGFGLLKNQPRAEIFSTTNPKIVEMFYYYFQRLQKDAEPVTEADAQ
ncbi:hypothetical protein [Rhodoplanes sp. SY1]|uniref:hypothetical protein n=1 Tax=Rhodoplanes sp. SY1 TaxID=3166646 RepID=UPI0038B623CC